MRPESSLRAALAVDLLDAVAITGDFSVRPSRSHPGVELTQQASAISFWLAHGVAGLVVRLYTPESLLAALGENGAAALRAAAQAYQRRALLFQHALRELLRAGQEANVWMMPFKGIMAAQELYGDPGARCCGDIDVLVKAEQMERASGALRALGYREVGSSATLATLQPRARAWWLTTSHSIDSKHPATGVLVDLHWRLNDLPMVRLDDSGWFQAAMPGTCWGVPCNRLPPVEGYIALLTHAARSSWFLLRYWADLVRARELAARSAAEALETRLAARGALELDRQWLDSLVELSEARSASVRPSSPVGWLLGDRRPTRVARLRYTLRLGHGWRYRARVLRRYALSWEDVALLSLPDRLFPLYFPMRPLLAGWRNARRYLTKTT